MILCSLSGPHRYRFTIAVLPIEQIFHRRGGNQQDKLRIRILCDDLPNCAGQLRARGGLIGQNEITCHIAPPEKLLTDNQKIGRRTSQIQGFFFLCFARRRAEKDALARSYGQDFENATRKGFFARPQQVTCLRKPLKTRNAKRLAETTQHPTKRWWFR